jgi:hypothetical protein
VRIWSYLGTSSALLESYLGTSSALLEAGRRAHSCGEDMRAPGRRVGGRVKPGVIVMPPRFCRSVRRTSPAGSSSASATSSLIRTASASRLHLREPPAAWVGWATIIGVPLAVVAIVIAVVAYAVPRDHAASGSAGGPDYFKSSRAWGALIRSSCKSIGSEHTAELCTPRAGGYPHVLSHDEVDHLLEHAFDVVLVPAGQLALADYLDLSVYVCQAGRTFRDARWIGFYAAAEIYPRIAEIRRTVDRVHLTAEEVSRLRAAGDDELADAIEPFALAPDRRGHRGGPHKVMLLSAPEDPETIKLPQSIRHLVRGRGQAFVRKQRYTTRAALERHPTTTAELLRYERE